MTRNELIDHMVMELMEEDCIDVGNFHDAGDALAAVSCIIRQSLQDYMIIQGIGGTYENTGRKNQDFT